LAYKLDCYYFIGEKPCRYQRLCARCSHYKPMGKRILIIKLSALGDVLRTTPILLGLKRKYPQSYITWLTEAEAYPLLETNPLIDRVLAYDLGNILRLRIEEYDLLLNFDKMIEAASLSTLVSAQEKLGFGLSKEGNIYPLNKESEYAFKLGLSNKLKFKLNKKTYPQLIYEMARLKYKRDEYVFRLTKEDKDFARDFFKKNNLRKNDIIFGFNTGAGNDFACKSWTEEGFVGLANKLSSKLGAKILLLGGPEEVEKNEEIKFKAKVEIVDASGSNSLRHFAGLIDRCSLIVSGDTLGMHLSIALKKKVVALFGSTCSQEIELYGRGKKIISSLSCSPCYKRECNKRPNCMDNISVEQVLRAVLGCYR